MMKTMGVLAIALVVACSSETKSDEPASVCADISGNYQVKSVRADGTCDPSLDGDDTSTVSFTKEAESWVLRIPSVPGGCPGTLDASSCQFVSNCEAKDGAGNVLLTVALDYTFKGAGKFSGSSAVGARPPAVTTACTVTYQEEGTKL